MSEFPHDPILDPLFAQARAQAPDTSRAEYAFETRLAARLGELKPAPRRAAWGAVSWRLMPLFLIVVLALAAWQSRFGADTQGAAQAAALDNPEAADLLANFDS